MLVTPESPVSDRLRYCYRRARDRAGASIIMSDKAVLPNAASSDGVSRRTVIHGAAWSLPVIAVAVAVPSATASTIPPVDLQVVSVIIAETPTGSQGADPLFPDNRQITLRVLYRNNSNETVPVGTQLQAYTNALPGVLSAAPTVAAYDPSATFVTGTRTATAQNVTVASPLAPGQEFWVDYVIEVNQLPGGRYGSFFTSTIANPSAQETDTSNNLGYESFWVEGTAAGAANLAVTNVTQPTWTSLGVGTGGNPIYQDLQYSTIDVTYANNGVFAIPAGATIEGFWTTLGNQNVFEVIGATQIYSFLGPWTTVVNTNNESRIRSTVNRVIAVGESFTIRFQVQGLDAAPGRYPSTFGGTITAPSTVIESATGDNTRTTGFDIAG